MSIWRRGKEKREQFPSVGLDEMGRMIAAQVTGSQSSADVNASSVEVAQQAIAVRTAVDLIASIVSELPVDVYSGDGPTRRPQRMPPTLADPAGDETGLEDWGYRLLYSWLYRGNAYGDVLAADGRGTEKILKQVDLFNPDKVVPRIEDGQVKWSVDGKDYTGRMMHRRVNPVPGQVLGLSVIATHATSIGLNISTTRFGKGFFDADANPTGILRNNITTLNPEQSKSVKQTFMAALRGSREPIVMGRGWEFSQLTVNPEESQFIATMGYTSADCARIFGPGIAEILGYDVGATLTYANVQDRDVQLLKYAVGKWIRRYERTLNLFLPRTQYVILNRDALLETSTMQRYQAYSLALAGQAWKEPNEVREKESLPPLPEPEPVPDDPGQTDPEPTPQEGEQE